jgi:hypothetical protein
LSKELEKDVIDSRLSALLKTFKTKDLDLNVIHEEVEMVRANLDTIPKNANNF